MAGMTKHTGKITDCCNAPQLTDGQADWCAKCRGVSAFLSSSYEAILTQADTARRPTRSDEGAIVFDGRLRRDGK